MAVIASNNFYSITNHSSHLHIITHKTPLFSAKLHFLSHHHHKKSSSSSSSPPLSSLASSSSSNNHSFDSQEHQQWLREEQRWLREEQRWLREESRWNNERQSLLRQISELSLQIQHLQDELHNIRSIRANSEGFDVDFEVTLTKMAKFLEAKSFNRISDVRDGSEVESSTSLGDLEEVESLKSAESVEKPPLSNSSSSLRSSLRVGAEGEDVRALQEALMKLGFYSGEEDMEYSSFSSGTEKAVKTWQASIGVREDGIMTVELLERLNSSQNVQSSSPSGSSINAHIPKDKANGAPVNVKEVKKSVEQVAPPDPEISHNRVFLLGENRWEEPSRLNKGNDKLVSGGKVQTSAPKCTLCRGEGRLMCMECDGTGDPNIEEQFLDWIEDGAKCPYCEGLGYIVCDSCGGKSAA